MKNKILLSTLISLVSSTGFTQVSFIQGGENYSVTPGITIQTKGSSEGKALDVETMVGADPLNMELAAKGQTNISGTQSPLTNVPSQEPPFQIDSPKLNGVNPINPTTSKVDLNKISNDKEPTIQTNSTPIVISNYKPKKQQQTQSIIQEDISSWNQGTIEQFEKQGRETTEKKYIDFLTGKQN
jgi:hypothetical protein